MIPVRSIGKIKSYCQACFYQRGYGDCASHQRRVGKQDAKVALYLFLVAILCLLAFACAGLPADAERDLSLAARTARAEATISRGGECERATDATARLLEALDERMKYEHGFSSWLRGFWNGLVGD